MHAALETICTIFLVIYYCLESLVLAILPSNLRQTKSIAGEIALVTGAGSGIGRLISIRLAKLGAKVVLWDLNAEGIHVTKQLIEKEGGVAYTYECDVTDRFLVYDTADRVRRDVGDVTILVNNAGIVNGKPLLDISDEKIQKVMDVNVTAHFWTLKAFLPHMAEQKHGHIVTISSLAGKVGANRCVDYCASKHAAVGLHSSLSQELRVMGVTGVHLTNICPFFINTGMFEGAKSRFPRLFPGLDQHAVADRVVQALLLNEHEVVIPSIFYAVLTLQSILPHKASIALEDLLGVPEIMSSFVGRDGATNNLKNSENGSGIKSKST